MKIQYSEQKVYDGLVHYTLYRGLSVLYRYARRNPIIQCALPTTSTYQSFLKVDQFEQSTTIGKPFAFLSSLKCIGN